MAIHSSILAWRIPRTEEPGRLQSVGLHRVGHDCSDLAHTLKTTVVQYNGWHSGLALSEQARRVTDRKRERRREMVELMDHQQQETEGKMQFHSCQTLMECTLASSKLCNLKVHVQGTYYKTEMWFEQSEETVYKALQNIVRCILGLFCLVVFFRGRIFDFTQQCHWQL